MDTILATIKKYYASLKKWFWLLPMWKRAIFTSLIGAAGGSSIIGFFNKYALFYHAIIEGFRVPMEGVEYLSLAVTLFSFVIILTSTIGTIIIYNALVFNAKVILKLLTTIRFISLSKLSLYLLIFLQVFTLTFAFRVDFDTMKMFFEVTFLKTWLTIFSISTLFILLINLIFNLRLEEARARNTEKIINIIKQDEGDTAPTETLLKGEKKSKKSKFSSTINQVGLKRTTLILVLTSIVVLISLLFNQVAYKKFLNTIKYGGGLKITIEYRKADNTEAVVQGALLIRTNKSITLKSLQHSKIEEIPNERISKIIWNNNSEQ